MSAAAMLEESLPATIPLDYPVEGDYHSVESEIGGGRKEGSAKRPRESDDDDCVTNSSSATMNNKIPKFDENNDDSSLHVLEATSSSAPSDLAPSTATEEDGKVDEDWFEMQARYSAEVSSSKYPFTMVTLPSPDPKLIDTREFQFHMDVDQIELLERGHFDKDEEEDDEEAKDQQQHQNRPKFKFVHFPGQFWLVNGKKSDFEDDDKDSLDSDEEEEYRRRPRGIAAIARFIDDDELRSKWITLAQDHEFERYNRLAKSPHPKENAWLQEKKILERKMLADSSACVVKSLLFSPTWDVAVQYRIIFSDSSCNATNNPFQGITEHMAICALEQILREKAPSLLKQEMFRFLRDLRKNCTDMAKRFAYIYDDNNYMEREQDDVLIGDLMTVEENDQEETQVVRRLNCVSRDDGEYEVTLSGIIV